MKAINPPPAAKKKARAARRYQARLGRERPVCPFCAERVDQGTPNRPIVSRGDMTWHGHCYLIVEAPYIATLNAKIAQARRRGDTAEWDRLIHELDERNQLLAKAVRAATRSSRGTGKGSRTARARTATSS